MPSKLTPRDPNFGSAIVDIVKAHVEGEFAVLSEFTHKEPDPKSQWTIKITVREKTDKEKKSEALAASLEKQIKS